MLVVRGIPQVLNIALSAGVHADNVVVQAAGDTLRAQVSRFVQRVRDTLEQNLIAEAAAQRVLTDRVRDGALVPFDIAVARLICCRRSVMALKATKSRCSGRTAPAYR